MFSLFLLFSIALNSCYCQSDTYNNSSSNFINQNNINKTISNYILPKNEAFETTPTLTLNLTQNAFQNATQPPHLSRYPHRDCSYNSQCGQNSVCYLTRCRCNLGYEYSQTQSGCIQIHCSKNLECLDDFTNVKCFANQCICDDQHVLDSVSQSCRYDSPSSPAVHILIGFGIGIGLILVIVGVVAGYLACRKGKSPGMIFVPTNWSSHFPMSNHSSNSNLSAFDNPNFQVCKYIFHYCPISQIVQCLNLRFPTFLRIPKF